MSKLININSSGQPNTSDFTISMRSPIELQGFNFECSLTEMDAYFSYYNVTTDRGNNIFSYNNGTDDVGLIIPDGLYSIENFIKKIQEGMKVEGDSTIVDGKDIFSINFYPIISTGKVDMVLSDGFTVDFTDNNIRLLLGFNSQIYTVSTASPNKADINYGVEKILIHCSLISGSSYLNGSISDVIFSFTPAQQENEHIEIIPQTLKYLKMNENNQITNIRMYLTDQRLIPIYFNNSPISYELHIKPLILQISK